MFKHVLESNLFQNLACGIGFAGREIYDMYDVGSEILVFEHSKMDLYLKNHFFDI